MVRTWLFDLYYAKVWVYLKSTSHHVFVVSGRSRISGKGDGNGGCGAWGGVSPSPEKILNFAFEIVHFRVF